MARGPELLIAQIAIAKTGAAWLPFDADAGRPYRGLPDRRRRPGACSVRGSAVKAEGHMPCPIWVDEGDCRSFRHERDRRARARRDAGSSAYMIYTSGSTGNAEGHRHHRPQHLPLSAVGEIYG